IRPSVARSSGAIGAASFAVNLRVGAVTACGENPTHARRSSCCQRERDSRSVIAMSENTPENPQDQQPHGADPLEAQTPEAEAAAEPADREESFSAAAIVNAPPTTEIDETEVGSDRPTHHSSSPTPSDEAQSPTRAYGQPPASSASASPAGQDIPAASGPQPGQDIPAAPEHNPDAPVAATGSGPATHRAPGAYPTAGAQPAYAPQPAPGHPASSPGPQPPHSGQPAPGPQANSPRPPNPGHPAAGP